MVSTGYLPCFSMLAWGNDFVESMEKARTAWVVKPWSSMEFHGKVWENSMEIHRSKIPWKAWGTYHAFPARFVVRRFQSYHATVA